MPEDSKGIIEKEDRYGANVYAKRPIVLARGRGATLWDINGVEYIDCTGGYGTCILGYSHPEVVKAVNRQLRLLSSCHGYAYNEARAELLELIAEISPKGLDKSFLSNSGAEAVECALKLARKYTGRRKIVAAVGGYHGKTMGALSATWNPKYRGGFEPLLEGVTHIPYGKMDDKVYEKVDGETAAVIVEPIQGEGGVRIPPPDYLRALRDLCDERGVLLVFDEVQTGFGRTGRIFACEHWNVTPDILCAAKGWAGGLPIGITVSSREIMGCLGRGEHTSTYGGNPVVAAAALASIKVLLKERLHERASRLGAHLLGKLKMMESKYSIVREGRGLGLMAALELRFDVLDVIMGAMERRVLVLDAGRNVVRFLPPLVIRKWQIDRVVQVLDELIEAKEDGIRGKAA
ncbi:MAG: aspartate aminotransferase family protein [Candidatus Bathyarchaeia archaeon]|nr:aspartate aminotransferase family protein [Candidatus Bathyarchaeota archaeon]